MTSPLPSDPSSEDAFPHAALDALRREGLLLAPFPTRHGGRGWGTQPAGAHAILDLLRRIGRSSLPLGRVYEGHVNAVRLATRYGAADQVARAAADAASGHLFAIWDAEAPDAPVRLVDDRLAGRKSFGSAAGIATRALVTAQRLDGDTQLVLAALEPGQGFDGRTIELHGMRGTHTGAIRLDGVPAPQASWIGAPGDYMRQPEISLGAWRTLAVLLGGLDALADALRHDLVARRRDADPHQRARFGQIIIAQETASLWVGRCAVLAEAEDAGEDAANYVKLARIAVEAAVLDAIRLAQRTAGLAGFVQSHPLERLTRDLATYLRQPALDEVLEEAGAHFMRHDPT